MDLAVMARVVALIENQEMADSLRHCLSDHGCELSLAYSFDSAKALIAEQGCDLIISEVHLENGGSVFEFLEFAKSLPNSSEIPFVLLSVKPSKVANILRDSLLFTASQLGAAKYVSMEEFDCESLVHELRDYLVY